MDQGKSILVVTVVLVLIVLAVVIAGLVYASRTGPLPNSFSDNKLDKKDVLDDIKKGDNNIDPVGNVEGDDDLISGSTIIETKETDNLSGSVESPSTPTSPISTDSLETDMRSTFSDILSED